MKRSRHRWLGLSLFCVVLAVISMELPTASAVRATALIFSKTSSTTAAPEEVSEGEDEAQLETTGEGEEGGQNATRKLSGIPQIDYIYDPNLPRELNGYNLSEYPFYETVPPPETMDFKCDGLHDGFYASVPHKCQVYHHCLFGTRYDFLCANYTAFDQKTFICHFVSEVDCKNSPNYFNRNEALYKAASTSPPPPPPTTSTTTTTTTTQRPSRPPRRRPNFRYDYYDDEYYSPARDDYDYAYEDRGGRTRRPQGRPMRPGKRRPYDDYEDKYDPRPRPRDESEDYFEERRPYDRRPAKRPYAERRPYDEEGRREERRPIYKGRRPGRPRETEDDRYKSDDERSRTALRDQKRNEYTPRDKTRPRDDDRPLDEEKPIEDSTHWEERSTDDTRYRSEGKSEDEIKTRAEVKSTDGISSRDEILSGNTEDKDDIKPRESSRSRDDLRPKDGPQDDFRARDGPRDEIRPRVEFRSRDEVRPRDEIRPREEMRPRDETRPRDDFKPREERRPLRFRDDIRTRDEVRPREERRPYRDDVTGPDDKKDVTKSSRYPSNEGRRLYNRDERPYRREERPAVKSERPYESEDKPEEEKRQVPSAPDGQPLVKPNGHGIFSQPRMPPKIKRPVPANEKNKYEYVPIATTKSPPKASDDEYYDEYEEEEVSKTSPSDKTSTIQQKPKTEPIEREKFKPTRSYLTNPVNAKQKQSKRPIDYEEDDYEYEQPAKKTTYVQRHRNERPPKPVAKDEDYYYEEDKPIRNEKPKIKEEEIAEKIKEVRPNVRIVKRPFLPSRGGSPYLPRGLLPVAGKDLSSPPNTTPKPTTTTTSTTTTTTRPPTTARRITTTTELITTTTEKLTTTIGTEKPTPAEHPKPEDEYEYYDEEDIEYESKDKKQTTTTEIVITTPSTTTTTTEGETTEQKAKLLATKVLRVFNDNYEAIRDKLQSTLSPGDYLKPYLGTSTPREEKRTTYRPVELKPEISKPYTATGRPLKIPEDISIKQNLADSVENDYDEALNEALAPISPKFRVPSGFVVSPDRDYTYSRFRNNLQAEPQFAASELSNFQLRKRPQVQGVSIRTPSSYYIQPQRITYQEAALTRAPRQLLYRQLQGFF